MEECIFCKIINGDFGTEFIYEDELFVAFNDINAQAPIHFLIVPKKHTTSLIKTEDGLILNKMLETVNKVCKIKNIDDFRVVINNGTISGQEVMHLHVHVLSGRELNWPPG